MAKDSEKTQVLFDKAVKEIESILNEGQVIDKAMTEVILKAFLGHIKVRNIEVREAALKFVISRTLAENIEHLKKLLPKSLPVYSIEADVPVVEKPKRGRPKKVV